MPLKPFVFICGPDDYLVNRLGRERFDALAADAADEFSREVLNGFAGNVGEVEAAVNRLREAVQTLGLFGGPRAVWLKDLNFLADTATGRAEGALRQVEELQEILARVNPRETAVLITAAPVDRRRAFLKWCEANADYTFVGDDERGDSTVLEQVALAEAKEQGVAFEPDALALLLARTGANARLVVEEVRKLAAYAGSSIELGSTPLPTGRAGPSTQLKAGEGGTITEAHVAELTPNFAEGDFFEVAEAFCRGDLKRTLAALERQFFVEPNAARPILASLQNRNRLLLQLRVLIDAGEVRLGPRGLDKASFDRAAAAHGKHFGGADEKSSFNVFTQNPWYLGKLAGGVLLSSGMPSLRRLIDNQQEFVAAFGELIRRPDEPEEVLREMAVRCLG